MEVGNLDDIIKEVWNYYPNHVDDAITYIAEQYEIDQA